jgi:N-acetylneuraminic acid mutarotase
MNRFMPSAIAAVVVATIVGFALLTRPAPSIGPSPAPGPTHEATPAPTARAAAWTATGAMIEARANHSATLLSDGKVLVAGGGDRGGPNGKFQLASAELYDPASGTWTATGSLAQPLDGHTATLLPDGTVLVAGGGRGGDMLYASAQLYHPASGKWTTTGSMAEARSDHTATLLPNGKVLVVGGFGADTQGTFTMQLATAELYDPASGTWSATGNLAKGRYGHTATLLPDGKVLVVGGYTRRGGLASAELYDPTSGTWTATGSMREGRYGHTAVLLPNGLVLVAGGFGHGHPEIGRNLVSAELYDPGTGSWSATGAMIGRREYEYDGRLDTATLLLDGKVLVAGVGTHNSQVMPTAELYDPATGRWTATARKTEPRIFNTATLLRDGRVLLAGGAYFGGSGPVASVELYDPGS